MDEEFKVDMLRDRRPVEFIKDRGDLCEKTSSRMLIYWSSLCNFDDKP